MDDLLREFLTETAESLDVVDVELINLENNPNDADILGKIFRLVHTIKGTCGFLGLPRLEALAHAAETLMGKYRDGMAVTPDGVTLILASIDRIKELLGRLEADHEEPEGADSDLIELLERTATGAGAAAIGSAPATSGPEPRPERGVKPGEVSPDELERAFRAAEGPDGIGPDSAAAIAREAAMAASGAPSAEPQPDAAPEPTPEAASAGARAAYPASGSDDEKTGERRESTVKNQSIRVNVDALENLMTMVSELVLTRNQLLEIVRRHEDSEFKVPLQRLSNVTAELQEGVMKTRMQPIGNAWQKLPRIVRDVGQDLGKRIELEMNGADTELDRQVLELIKDPLIHMVRNSAGHGLETPAERRAAGKAETGRITLSAYHEGGHIIISVRDDGRGLDLRRIREKVLRSGLASEVELEQMSEAQIHKFIFHAGFSTAQEVTSVSGRGVGMDVVRTNIELIGGSIEVKSALGKGTTFTIKIPLTLAIVSALIVEAGGHRFAIPQLSVIELVRAQSNSDHRIEMIKETPVLRLRNKLLPLVHLRKTLDLERAAAEPCEEAGAGAQERRHAEQAGFIVVTQVGSRSFGIIVDGVFHTEEIVVKPMATMLRDITMFSGNTILGDGSVILIIDPNGVAQTIGNDDDAEIETGGGDQAVQTDSDGIVSMLLFRAASSQPKAVPLSLVTRLEEIEADKIELSNGRYMVQYRGSLMPLVFFAENGKPRESGAQPLLVFTEDERSMGLAVDEIVDIVEDRLDIEISANRPGLLGSAVVRGRATEIVDVAHYLPQAFADWFDRKDLTADQLSRRVLLVDDSAFFRNMLTPVLRSSGFDVTAVDGAAAALALLDKGARFDVVVTDIEMPGMNGFELAEKLNGEARRSAMPIIALSSYCTAQAIERGRQAGFTDYVAKFDREGLIIALRQSQLEIGEAA